MPDKPSIAALLTCHNRKEKTLKCLEALLHQKQSQGYALTVQLVDDGSTDGTGEAIRQAYPEVNVLTGDGNLFWVGGMRLAFTNAEKKDPDFYLWLNDDVVLDEDALDRLLSIAGSLDASAPNGFILATSMRDPQSGEWTYGGWRRGVWHPLKFKRLKPGRDRVSCDTMNGNCVLVSRKAARIVGNLSSEFKHHMADFDYGLQAAKKRVPVWLMPGYQGTCPRDHEGRPSQAACANLKKQWVLLSGPRGMVAEDGTILSNPGEWKVFAKRHGGLFWFVFWILPYRRLFRFKTRSDIPRG